MKEYRERGTCAGKQPCSLLPCPGYCARGVPRADSLSLSLSIYLSLKGECSSYRK